MSQKLRRSMSYEETRRQASRRGKSTNLMGSRVPQRNSLNMREAECEKERRQHNRTEAFD